LSYLTGTCVVLGWLLGGAGVALYAAYFYVALGILINDQYVPETYHIYLITLATIFGASLLNTYGVKLLPGLNKFLVIYLNVAAFYCFVVLLATTSPKNSAREAFFNIVNETGYSSDGFIFLLGFLPGMLTMSVPDAPAHMAQEVADPDRTIPLVMVATTGLNALAGLIMVITLIFCTIRPENLQEPLAGQTVLQLAWDAFQNKPWVITVALILISFQSSAAIAILTGGSRLFWSFANAGGLPFGQLFGRTNQRLKVPVVAVTFCAFIASAVSLLVFGPYTVLSGIFGASVLLTNFSCWMPIFFMMLKPRKALPEARYFNLGRVGPFINIAALLWLTLTEVAICIPTYHPVTPSTMQWASVVFVGCLFAALSNWLFVRRSYQIPKAIYVPRLHGNREITA
jgi:choline transport protein